VKAEVRRLILMALKAAEIPARLAVTRQNPRKTHGNLAAPPVAYLLQLVGAEPGQRLASTGNSFHL
jgi:hypothetical protein